MNGFYKVNKEKQMTCQEEWTSLYKASPPKTLGSFSHCSAHVDAV